MNYYKAYEQDTAPFLLFKLVATSIEELTALGLENDPLVKAEDQLPSYVGDICHLRVQNGALIARDQGQIDAFVASTTENKTIAENAALKANVNGGEFVFGGKTWPMDEASQARYVAMFNLPAVNTQLQTKTGVETLDAADIPNFKTAYYTAVLLVTAP